MDLNIGTPLRDFPHTQIRKVADLIYYEGPLLSLYETWDQEYLLYLWCDTDSKYNRWLVFTVSSAQLTKYLTRERSLRSLVLSPQGDKIYVLDYDDELYIRQKRLLTPDQLSESYIPTEDSIYRFQPVFYRQVEDGWQSLTRYRIAMDGQWLLDQLGEFSHIYGQIYAFMNLLVEQARGRFGTQELDVLRSYPWRGGFSAVNFFNRLLSIIPLDNQLQIHSIQYASPGSLNLRISLQPACQVRNSVLAYLVSGEEIDELYKRSHGFLQSLDALNKTTNEANLTQEHQLEIASFTRELAEYLQVDEFVTVATNSRVGDLEICKMLFALYRRIKQLADFQRKGLAGI